MALFQSYAVIYLARPYTKYCSYSSRIRMMTHHYHCTDSDVCVDNGEAQLSI